jgi:ribonuclease Z
MRLIMLGTGEAMAVKCYNTCFILEAEGEYFLVDGGGGNGILVQLQKAGVAVGGLHHMFVTHEHADHVLGAVWRIRCVAEDKLDARCPGRFIVYGHARVLAVISQICRMLFPQKLLKYFDNGICFHEVNDGGALNLLQSEFRFFDIHSQKAKQFGFRARLPTGKRSCAWRRTV